MAQVIFTPNLQRHLDCPPAATAGATVAEAMNAVFGGNPRLRSYLVDEHGRLRKHVNLFVNDRPIDDRIGLSDPIGPDDEIYVFQALSGG